MSKIRLNTIAQALVEIKKLQAVCKKYREENEDLKMELKRFKDLREKMPDFFMKGFAKK